MRLLVSLVVSALLSVVTLASAGVTSAKTTYDDVAPELTCQCGCQMVLNACDMKECKVQFNMNTQIKNLLNQGQEKEEIIRYFVANYGEVVLSAPTKNGFNLMAWVTPFVAIAGGLAFVYVLVDNWVLQRGRVSEEEEETVELMKPGEFSRYEERLRKELEHYEGGA